jgi:alpha-1,3-mannosyltransferase
MTTAQGDTGREAFGNVPRWDILGIPVIAGCTDEVVAELDWRLAKGERIRLAYLNAHSSNLAATDSTFRAALIGFTILNDGIGLDIAARVLNGVRFPENLNGTDFTLRYLDQTRHRFRLYLLGAHAGVAEAAAAALHDALPRHAIAGTHHGFFRDEDALRIAGEIRASGADVVLVALGNPAQELWIETSFDATGCRLAIGVGALFDFVAGGVSRAPPWLRKLRMEWLFRLALEPRRLWRRYLFGNPVFLARVAVARLVPRSSP